MSRSVTAKSRSITTNDTFNDFIGYASLGYKLSRPRKFTLTTQQAVDVSDQSGYQNIRHKQMGLAFDQQLAHKLRAKLKVAYKRDKYRYRRWRQRP